MICFAKELLFTPHMEGTVVNGIRNTTTSASTVNIFEFVHNHWCTISSAALPPHTKSLKQLEN